MGDLKEKDVIKKIILLFIIGSVFGSVYEELLHIIKHLVRYGTIDIISTKGLLYGPFSPIYGIGAVLIYALFYIKNNNKWYITFLYGCLFGGFYEYNMGLLQEKIWRTVSWDYSNEFLNIGGRTTIPFMIVWGLIVIGFVYLVFPLFDKLYNKIKSDKTTIAFNIIFVLLIIDVIVTIAAVTRQTMRKAGHKPMTFIGELCDKYYTDEFLKTVYTGSKDVKP